MPSILATLFLLALSLAACGGITPSDEMGGNIPVEDGEEVDDPIE